MFAFLKVKPTKHRIHVTYWDLISTVSNSFKCAKELLPGGKQRKKSTYDSKSPYIAKHIRCNFDLARHLSIC